MSESEAKLLKYNEEPSMELRNELVMDYIYLVRNVAKSTRGLYANYANFEDVVNNGVITLIDCIEKYDIKKGMLFEPYAYTRIKQATIDYIRKSDYLPRRVRQQARDVSRCFNELANQLMREPSDVELAEYMHITLEELNHHYSEMSTGNFLSVEELSIFLSNDDYEDKDIEHDPKAQFEKKELRRHLINAINTLNDKERIVISLFYYESLKLKEIAEVLEVSDARVSQIHSKAILKLKSALIKEMDGEIYG